jgi:L-threonylcarbamoyladenylate synthase
MESNAAQADITHAATLLARGKLVAFPTETVYGLGADARNEAAIAKIYAAKGRPSNNPLIVHVATVEDLRRYADISASWNPAVVDEWITKLTPLWPGPLSVILPRGKEIAPNVCAGGPTVALRIPRHPVALDLLCAFKGPVAAPSANPSMYVSPTTAQHVRDSLGDKVDLILDGGSCDVGLESTVLSLLHGIPRVVRPGAVTLDMLRHTLGCPVEGPLSSGDSLPSEIISPGLLAKHYSPRTPVRLRTSLAHGEKLPQKTGVLVFSHWQPEFTPYVTKVLSQCGDLEEVAARLFGALRELDESGLELIVVDTCEPLGLGEAIMDRLIRASQQ